MKILFKNKEVGSLGIVGASYVFTIKTEKTHSATEFTAKNLAVAIKKCENICEELVQKKRTKP